MTLFAAPVSGALPRESAASEALASDASVVDSSPTAWAVPLTLFASTCIVVGLIWDISWHRSVGRDTFWTYPHVLEQIAAIISGLGCGWLVLWTTFARSAEARMARAEGVGFWGFRGPLGAWVCIWGTMMMIVSAPFDNWWHNAYGLDVKIVSPPHSLLAAGMIAVELGAMLIALAAQNRVADTSSATVAESSDFRTDAAKRNAMFVYGAGVIVTMVITAAMEYAAFPNEMHSPLAYQVLSLLLPVLLIAFASASRLRWAATWIAAIYMGSVAIMSWILQLFPAVPRLAPIYNPITHMVPPPFPILLVIPAVVVDILRRRVAQDSPWRQAVTLGLAFFVVLLVVQWFFADFLLTPHAENWFFAAGQWDYNARPGAWQHEFFRVPRDLDGHILLLPMIWGMSIAALWSVLSSRVGLACGRLLASVKR